MNSSATIHNNLQKCVHGFMGVSLVYCSDCRKYFPGLVNQPEQKKLMQKDIASNVRPLMRFTFK
jgi:hypothetical protein